MAKGMYEVTTCMRKQDGRKHKGKKDPELNVGGRGRRKRDGWEKSGKKGGERKNKNDALHTRARGAGGDQKRCPSHESAGGDQKRKSAGRYKQPKREIGRIRRNNKKQNTRRRNEGGKKKKERRRSNEAEARYEDKERRRREEAEHGGGEHEQKNTRRGQRRGLASRADGGMDEVERQRE